MKSILLAALLASPAEARDRRYAQATPDIDMMKYGPCPTVPVTGFQLAIGHGHGNEAQALRQAREEAHNDLLDRLTTEYSPLRRAAVERHIVPWMEGEYKGRNACAAVAIDDTHIDSFEQDARQLETDLVGLAAGIIAAAPGKLIQIAPPIWESSGCVSEIGGYLIGNIRNHLAQNTVGITLVPPRESSTSATVLRMSLAPGVGEVVLEAALRPPDSIGELPLVGVNFPMDLLNVAEGDAGECYSEDALGLEDGEKLGADGLRVKITMDTTDGTICEGATGTARLTVNQAALVKVFSVDREGNAWLVWPPPDQPNTVVQEEIALPEMTAVSLPEQGDERLVAVAAPVGAPGHLSKIAGWSGFCRLQGELGPGTYGSGAALGSMTYTVLPAGTRGCTWNNLVEQNVFESQEALERVGACP